MSTTKPCQQTSLATDNTPLECEEFFSTACVVHPDALVELNLPENSTTQDIINAFLNAIINVNNQLGMTTNVEVVSGEVVGTDIVLTKSDSNTVTIDASSLFDDTNLARITSGAVVGTDLVLTRDDSTTVTIDATPLLDNSNLSRITSGSVSGSTMTLTRDDSTTVDIDVSSLVGGATGVQSVVAGAGISVDNTDPANPIVSATGSSTASGFEAIDEGNGIGWRLIGRDPAEYGNIGLDAIDASASDNASFPSNGATGDYATISGGLNNTVEGNASTVGGGQRNLIQTIAQNSTIAGGVLNDIGSNSNFATIGGGSTNVIQASAAGTTIAGGNQNTITALRAAIGGGFSNTAGNTAVVAGGSSNNADIFHGVISGGFANTVTGEFGGIGNGSGNFSRSYGEFVVGIQGTDYTPNSTTDMDDADRIFNVGNGQRTSLAHRSDALTVLKGGQVFAPSVDNAKIDAATGDILITKDWFNANVTGGTAPEDIPYDVSWNGNTAATTKNTIYDKIESLTVVDDSSPTLTTTTNTYWASNPTSASVDATIINDSVIAVNGFIAGGNTVATVVGTDYEFRGTFEVSFAGGKVPKSTCGLNVIISHPTENPDVKIGICTAANVGGGVTRFSFFVKVSANTTIANFSTLTFTGVVLVN